MNSPSLGLRLGAEVLGTFLFFFLGFNAVAVSVDIGVGAIDSLGIAFAFGLGLALSRQGRFEQAANYLSAASTMRPARDDYRDALRQVLATLRARQHPG